MSLSYIKSACGEPNSKFSPSASRQSQIFSSIHSSSEWYHHAPCPHVLTSPCTSLSVTCLHLIQDKCSRWVWHRLNWSHTILGLGIYPQWTGAHSEAWGSLSNLPSHTASTASLLRVSWETDPAPRHPFEHIDTVSLRAIQVQVSPLFKCDLQKILPCLYYRVDIRI